ncbi:MAG: TlpA family protein disulfide reductase [Verrucomicrobiota bacterium]
MLFRLRSVAFWRLRALPFACALRRHLGLAALLLTAVCLPPAVLAQSGPGATKQSLGELIRGDRDAADLSADTVAQVKTFLDDKSKPVRDRLEVKIAFEQARLKRRHFSSRDQQLQAHADHAAELMREFPYEPEGYGYQLSLAKAENPPKARRLAESLLDSPAPPQFKRGAQRVLARLALEGGPLRLAGVDAAVNAARGQPLAIYVWTAQSAGIKEAVRRLAAERRDFAFIGINLDADVATAKAAAAGLPGAQFYDGDGLDGPLARQLQLTMGVALYLVDADGVIRDVDAYRDPLASARRIAKGGRK